MTGRRRALDDLDGDIRDHIERETQDNIDRGMTPQEARRQAMISFGCINSAPHAPIPPARITAIDNDGGQAPAIGASKIGTCIPNRSQNDVARALALVTDTSSFLESFSQAAD